MNPVKQIWAFLRWRVIGVRYLTRLTHDKSAVQKSSPSVLPSTALINEIGLTTGPKMDDSTVEKILTLYKDRIQAVVPKPTGHPFVNLMNAEDITTTNPILQKAFSKEVFDPAADYFGGQVTLDSIQFLFSWPTNGQLRASQQWHKDFGDSKSFHAIFYLKDVTEIKDGPFVFVDKKNTKRIRWSPFIRRISDKQFLKELGDGEVKYFYGKSGESVFVDPAACYHFGSRCENPRLALFITFNSSRPFVPATDLIKNNAQKLLQVATELRPDLSRSFLASVLNTQA